MGSFGLACWDNQAHNANINALAFSCDNHHIALGTSDRSPRSLSFWDLDAVPEYSIQEAEEGHVLALVSYPNERRFATVNDRGILHLWSDKNQTGLLHKSKSWQSHSCYSLILSHDGRWFFNGGTDGIIRQWDAMNGGVIRTYPKQNKQIRSLALSHDGKTLVSGSDQRIKIWNAKSGEVRQSFFGHPDWVRGLAITKDDQFLISVGDHKINIWDLATGQKLQSIKAHPAAIRSLALSRDGSLLVTGSRDGTVKVWKIGA